MHRAADPIGSITPTRAVIVLLHIASRLYVNPAAVWVLHTFGLSPYSLRQRRAASVSFDMSNIAILYTLYKYL